MNSFKTLKNELFPVLITFLLFSCIALMHACVPKTISNAQTWSGKMTGMATGHITIKDLPWIEKSEEIQIKSHVHVKIKSTRGHGDGQLDGTLSGKIVNGKLIGRFSGTAYVLDGQSRLYGTMTGNFVNNKGFGSYRFQSRDGFYTGEWEIKKDVYK